MRHATTGEARQLEVWNRATSGEPASDRAGDQALADALCLLGYAEGDGLLSAVEHEREQERHGAFASALRWFGLKDAARLVDEVAQRWHQIAEEPASAPGARAAALAELETEADRRYALLDLGAALESALSEALTHRPEHFADEGDGTAAETQPSTTSAAAEHPGWAVCLPPEEKLRRTAQAYEAFGIRAEVDDGQLLVWPPDEAGWEVLDEVTRLLDHRYPAQEDR